MPRYRVQTRVDFHEAPNFAGRWLGAVSGAEIVDAPSKVSAERLAIDAALIRARNRRPEWGGYLSARSAFPTELVPVKPS